MRNIIFRAKIENTIFIWTNKTINTKSQLSVQWAPIRHAQIPNELLCFMMWKRDMCFVLPACVGTPTTPENENDPTRKYLN